MWLFLCFLVDVVVFSVYREGRFLISSALIDLEGRFLISSTLSALPRNGRKVVESVTVEYSTPVFDVYQYLLLYSILHLRCVLTFPHTSPRSSTPRGAHRTELRTSELHKYLELEDITDTQ